MVCFSVALCHSNLHYQCLKINKINLSFHFKLIKEQNLLGVLFQEQAINIYILCLPFTYGHILWWCVTKFLNCMTVSCCKFGYKLETGLKTPKSKLKISRSLYPWLQIYNSFMFSYAASSFIGFSQWRRELSRLVGKSELQQLLQLVLLRKPKSMNSFSWSFFISVLNFCHESCWCRKSFS